MKSFETIINSNLADLTPEEQRVKLNHDMELFMKRGGVVEKLKPQNAWESRTVGGR